MEDYAAEGKSLGRQDGKVIFIEQAIPGDVVDVRLGKNKKDWAEGRPIFFHQYSKDRIQPFCQHFGVCGGCQWQMLPYEKQLAYKQKQVYDHLTRIAKVPIPDMLPIAGASETMFYRNKLEYTFSTREFTAEKPQKTTLSGDHLKKETGDHDLQEIDSMPGAGAAPENSAALGFHAKGFFDKIVDIKKCWLQAEPTNALRNALRNFALEKELSFYDIRNHKGLLRLMQVRVCTTGEVMVNIVFGENNKTQIAEVMSFVEKDFPAITSLLYTINLKWNDSLFDQEPVCYKGKNFIIEQLENFHFKIGPKSFFQTNTRQGEHLYQIARDFAELDGSQVVYDLYCGTGSIGIFCSKGAKKIIGVELIDAAIEDARENALINNIKDAAFFTGDVSEVCIEAFFTEHGKPDVIITDPPRAGMHEKLVLKILEIESPIVVYVSCNPATQARDLNVLGEKYSITKIQPVDMFPHTHHIENVVQLKLKRTN